MPGTELSPCRTMASGEHCWPPPMKAIGAQNLLTMPGGVTVSGYLHKKGGTQLQLLKWPLRYVIIHKGCVYYFRSSTSASSQGAFSLNGYNRVMRAAEETTSSNVFPFKIVHISKKNRTWYFSAASEDERKKWMLSLRKEIDRYHEKGETVTDLSDTDSESDSFYGSVERAVDIKYTDNPADDTWPDEDDDEEDYETPDGEDAACPPMYPPPPVPRTPKNNVELQTRHSSCDFPVGFKQLPPLPPSKNISPDLKVGYTTPRKESIFLRTYNTSEPGIKPPPLPLQPTAHRMEPPALPPPKKSLPDLKEIEQLRLRKKSTCLPDPCIKSPHLPPQSAAHSIGDLPPLPPMPHMSYLKKGFSYDEAKGTKLSAQESCNIGLNHLNRDLNNKFKALNISVPPPIPQNKPATKISLNPHNRPNNLQPPIPPTKPKILGVPEKLEVNSPREGIKPGLVKPAPIPRMPARRSETNQPAPSPKLRSPPDGQSFRSCGVELPVCPAKPSLSKEDSDEDDYETVPLPASVFIDTNESLDVERMFKAMNSDGSPKDGLFGIRNSSKAGKVLVVWDKLADKLRNYRIFEKDSNVYLEGEQMFRDFGTLVEHYYNNTLPSHESLLLQHAYGCVTPR
ncbi:SH3 domain-binding protein 2 isoform X4 [Ascaphus truei]|uniref:SH3 domain-binding protein 2 isoform X4 n=1 Tax=Ascaphus truei TaxID=8439 RepID=UPI003F59A327